MNNTIKIIDVQPSVFLRKKQSILEQLIKITIENSSQHATSGMMQLHINDTILKHTIEVINAGQSTHEVFIPEQQKATPLKIILKSADFAEVFTEVTIHPIKHWQVHVVQLSHHDLGYTGLPSNVESKYARYLDNAIDMAAANANLPYDAQFRISIEQQWSLEHFLNVSPQHRIDKMIKLLQSGHFELTALFGNMTTEIAGHESLIRTFYPSFRLKKQHNIPIISAEHNDITGISWGLCRLLADMDIKIFCPGIPLYYDWASGIKYQSFWDQKAVFGYDDAPGAFWWEAANGKKILFWCNNAGCGGSADPALPGIESALLNLETKNYKSSVLRWPVQGGCRDNSPYISDFSPNIKEWNEKWEYPHLISSTNAIFYKAFSENIPEDLPVHRGELPGQDYPVGAMSAATATIQNRNNHQSLLSAEKLATVAAEISDYEYQAFEIEKAYNTTLRFEEHAFGNAYPAGNAMDGAEAEKALNSATAASFSHDIIRKSVAKIADNIKKDENGYYLVVFNTLSRPRSKIITQPMRELENSESIMERRDTVLHGISLPGRKERTHLFLPEEFFNGNFELIDADSEKIVPYQIVEISSEDTIPYAGQRAGLAQGRKDYFNHPQGLNLDLCFYAEDIPALGYKTYYLRKTDNAVHIPSKPIDNSKTYIENQYYRISVNPETFDISISDKTSNSEIIDNNAIHRFGDIITRNPVNDVEETAKFAEKPLVWQGDLCSKIIRQGSVKGHPVIRQTVTIYENTDIIDFDCRILKDSTPLLDVHIAFPFAMKKPEFSYEGTLNILNPVKDFFPAAYSDRLPVQNWVKVKNKTSEENNLLWCPHDSPIVSLGKLWQGYTSPAHSCVLSKQLAHPPQQEADFNKGWIYSNIFNNNFCTNFSIAQTGEFLFRYSFTTQASVNSDKNTVYCGTEMITPMEHIFTSSDYQGELHLKQGFIDIENNNLILLNIKQSDDSKGIVMRFWNPENCSMKTKIICHFVHIKKIFIINHTEEVIQQIQDHEADCFTLELNANETISVLIEK